MSEVGGRTFVLLVNALFEATLDAPKLIGTGDTFDEACAKLEENSARLINLITEQEINF